MRSRRFWGHPIGHLLLCMKKVNFLRFLGLWWDLWDQVRSSRKENLKILEGPKQMLFGTPHMPPFALFKKSVFGGKRKSSPGGWVRSRWKKKSQNS